MVPGHCCMFAEDIALLPDRLFTKVLFGVRNDPKALARKLKGLFQAMASGGEFGAIPSCTSTPAWSPTPGLWS